MDLQFNFTNYQTHPANRNYEVFSFKQPVRAAYFENMLIEHKITFEKDEETTEKQHYFLYAIHKKDFRTALMLNNLTIGHFRKPFISDPNFRWLVLLIGIGAVTLAITGFIFS